jgi:ketosteroid isomerase-like protein
MSVYFLRRFATNLAATGMGVAFALTACQPSGPPPASANANAAYAARAASAAWDDAHNAADLPRLIQLYSESAVSMPCNRPAIEGRSAIEADFREFFAGFNARHKTTIVSLEVAGDWAIERGTYELSVAPKAGGPTVSELGKHIVVRRKVDGAWKIQWEIWNTDAAPSQ